MLLVLSQERRDLVSGGQFSSASASPSAYSSSARFSGGGDFNAPYFPPPFPQQQLDFHPHVAAATADAYSHLNSFPGHQQWSHAAAASVAAGQRNAARDAQEAAALHSFQAANGQLHPFQQAAYDQANARRSDYPQIRRPDILVHTGGHSGIPSDQDLMQLSSASMLQQVMDVDGLVSQKTSESKNWRTKKMPK